METKYPLTPEHIFRGEDDRWYWHYNDEERVDVTDHLIHWKCTNNPEHEYQMSLGDRIELDGRELPSNCPVCVFGEEYNHEVLSLCECGGLAVMVKPH